MNRPRIQTMHWRVLVVALTVCFVALIIAAILADAHHNRMVMGIANIEAKQMINKMENLFQPRFPVLYINEEAKEDFDLMWRHVKGSARISIGDTGLWQSASWPQKVRPAETGGIVTISDAGRMYVAYLFSVTKLWPGVKGSYPVTYQVLLEWDEYHSNIRRYRYDLAQVVAIAMVVLVAAMHFVIARELGPLKRLTRSIRELDANSDQQVKRCDSDPREIRTLADRINEFLQTQAKHRQSVRDQYSRLDQYLYEMEESIKGPIPNSGGFKHSLGYLMEMLLPTDSKAITREDQDRTKTKLEFVHKKIEKMFDYLLIKLASEPEGVVSSTDVVEQAESFIKQSEFAEAPAIHYFIPDKKFALRHKEERLHARIEESLLSQLIQNLLLNAGKVARERVWMTIGRSDKMVKIVVEDDGPGFPPLVCEILTNVGNEASSLLKIEDERRHGRGLPHMLYLTREHRGTMSFEKSDEFGGARVVVELPLGDVPAEDAAGHSASDDTA